MKPSSATQHDGTEWCHAPCFGCFICFISNLQAYVDANAVVCGSSNAGPVPCLTSSNGLIMKLVQS